MELKQQKVIRLKNSGKISVKDQVYYVRSFTDESKYYEINKTKKECACPAFQKNRKLCKHLKKILHIEDTSGFTVSLMKSCLQKAIRRNQPYIATKIAKKLIRKDVRSFLRRCGVVLIEDCMLHPDFERLIQLVSDSSSKDFVLTDKDEKFCLQIVEQSARCLYRDFEFLDYQQGRKENDLPDSFIDLKKEEQGLVRALRWRAGLGGMKDDMEMLRICSRIWIRRFQNGEFRVSELKKYFPKPEIDYSKIFDRDDSDDILLEAVDFHVLKSIPKMLLRKKQIKEQLTQESGLLSDSQLINLITQVIWRCRSGINHKLDIRNKKQFEWLDNGEDGVYKVSEKEKYLRIYKIIMPDLNRIGQWYVRKNLEN